MDALMTSKSSADADQVLSVGNPLNGGGPLYSNASIYSGAGFRVDLTGLDTGSTTLSHWSYISLVITGPKLQFEGPGRGDQLGFTGYISSSEDVAVDGPEFRSDV